MIPEEKELVETLATSGLAAKKLVDIIGVSPWKILSRSISKHGEISESIHAMKVGGGVLIRSVIITRDSHFSNCVSQSVVFAPENGIEKNEGEDFYSLYYTGTA